MACASFLSHRFDLGWGAPVAYTIAGAVGVGRMVDRRHWLSDTMLGSFFGYAIGNTIAARSKARLAADQRRSGSSGTGSADDDDAAPLSNLYFAPMDNGAFGIGWSRRF
jgi:hypothetical protein